jgi:chromosome segregation ATPase
MRIKMESKQERVDRLEAERIARSNAQREIEKQKVFINQVALDVHNTKDRIAELRKEIGELEIQLASRERRLDGAKARLVVMQSEASA